MKAEPITMPEKKPYRTPSLVSYGGLREITNNVGMSGGMDGGSNKLKTAA